MNKIRVRLADWHKDNADIRRIREAVFIAEQHVPPELEWDSEDPTAVHFLALEGDYPIGTARLLPDGTIVNASVTRSSGDAAFDNSAVAAVRNVGRIPEMQQLDAATFNAMYRQRRMIFKPEDLAL